VVCEFEFLEGKKKTKTAPNPPKTHQQQKKTNQQQNDTPEVNGRIGCSHYFSFYRENSSTLTKGGARHD